VQAVWTDATGNSRHLVGRCVDVSEVGISVELKERIEPRSSVNFQVDAPRFGGAALVRHCTRSKLGWHCGMEFTGGLRWKFATKPGQDRTGSGDKQPTINTQEPGSEC
jgi:hypothetical protein